MSWLQKEWPKTVVLIEQCQSSEKGIEFIPMGAGFITECNNVNILVTCKHVIFDLFQKKFNENLYVSYNLKNGLRGRRKLEDIQKITPIGWVFHENEAVDLAVLPYLIDEVNDDIIRMGRTMYEPMDNLSEGDDVFFLGFPLGLDMGVNSLIRPVVRQGMISLIQPDKNFLIDANVFPGNSGSPVFLKPTMIDYKTNTVVPIKPAKFIGIISGYLSYSDTAISSHTKRPRVVFEENSGLARVISVNLLNEIFDNEKFSKLIQGLT